MRSSRLLSRIFVLLGVGLASLASSAAPTLVSVQPANNATGVALTSPLVFVFSETMAEVDAFPSFPPFLVGNFEVTPEDVGNSYGCEWSADFKTLTCTPSEDLPASTKVSWKLNPSGTILPFTSASGSPLAAATGSFTTGASSGGGGGGGGGSATAPKLVSATPANGASDVPVASTVVFVFDQAMKPNPQLGGVPPFVKGAVSWSGTGLDASKFSYAWSADSKSVTATYSTSLPGNTTLTGTLNPAGALFQLTNQKDEAVATTTGSFTTGQGSGGGGGGGNPGCNENPTPNGWGSYGVTKSGSYVQTSGAEPAPAAEDPFQFGVFVTSPAAGPAITSGSLTLPGGTLKTLEAAPFGGFLFYSETPATSAALEAAAPAGNYTLRLQPSGQAERSLAMTIPANNPPIPTVANYPETQAVNPAADFTLRWGAFTGAGNNDYISLTIHDTTNVVFAAPDLCVPRELPVTATSIVIPANTLRSGKVYDARLSFGRGFYSSTNAIPNMSGFGSVGRETAFTLSTGGATPPAQAARFTAWEVLPNGRPRFTFTGSAGRAYTLQRASAKTLPLAWTNAGTATPNAQGTATFEDTTVTPSAALLYRAVAP